MQQKPEEKKEKTMKRQVENKRRTGVEETRVRSKTAKTKLCTTAKESNDPEVELPAVPDQACADAETHDPRPSDLEESDYSQRPDHQIPVDISSLEAQIGYSSLLRLMRKAFLRRVAYYRSREGGALTADDARERAFHRIKNRDQAIRELNRLLSRPVEDLDFVDFNEIHAVAPKLAERLWEEVKLEGQKEFESGHLAANITFPAGYMKQVWNIARYMGVRQSFIEEWRPKGGIEISMIDMLAQSYFQWQYWLEKTVERSETPEKEEHPAYTQWKQYRAISSESSPFDNRWIRPYVSEVRAIEHAVQMADRFHRMFMRTLRQLRDLRRYSSVTITNANQVNIATDGGKQANIAASTSGE